MMLIYFIHRRLLTSIAITVPTCAYLLQPKSHEEHHHEDHHGHEDEQAEKAHGEEALVEEDRAGHQEGQEDDGTKEQHDDAQGAEEPSGQKAQESTQSDESSERLSEESKPEKSDISESQDDGPLARFMDDGGEMDPKEKEDRAHASDRPLGKGPRRDSPPSDSREHIPDAKGAAKNRIDSEYGHRQGPERPEVPAATDFVKDQVCSQIEIPQLVNETYD